MLPGFGHEKLTSGLRKGLGLVGRTLTHYRINAALDAGGMGQVYRATDTKLGRDVALKVLPAEMALCLNVLEKEGDISTMALVSH